MSERSERTFDSSSERTTGSSSEHSADSSGERSEHDAVSGSGQHRPPSPPESEAERTTVITNPVGEPVHGRRAGLDGADEQAPPNGLFTPGLPAGAPPWQREGAVEPSASTEQAASQSTDAGTPWFSTDGREAGGTDDATVGAAIAEEPTERTYAFSEGPPPDMADAPTSYVERVTESTDDDTEHFRSRLRSTEESAFQPPPEAPRPAASARVRSNRAPRRASLQIKRFDPWSVLKLSLVLSVAGFLAWLVAVGVLYGVLEAMGVWDQLNGTYSDLTSITDPQAGDELISGGKVFAFATVVGAINIVLLTALATVGAFIYNVSSDLAGGVELTLSERD